jgi:hypothetical protein
MSTNTLAADVKAAYANDAVIQKRYHSLLNGKWNHMMDQLHFGYTNWLVSPSSYVSNEANCWRRSMDILKVQVLCNARIFLLNGQKKTSANVLTRNKVMSKCIVFH